MTEHLPECWATYPSDPPAWCICERLRACEQRIKTHEGCGDAERIEGYVDGYADALDDAWEAMLGAKAIDVYYGRGLDEPPQFIWLNNALSAIDALRGKQ